MLFVNDMDLWSPGLSSMPVLEILLYFSIFVSRIWRANYGEISLCSEVSFVIEIRLNCCKTKEISDDQK